MENQNSHMIDMRYKLNDPMMAVIQRAPGGESKLLTIPAGAILRLAEEAPSHGLVNATWEGHVIHVFVEDLESRGRPIEPMDAR